MYTSKPRATWQQIRKHQAGHWRYAPFLPDVARRISLDEGHTPLVTDGRLHFKLEGCNPTGSFKDRGTTVEISLANRPVVCATTGNMGASVAAYCAQAKLPCTIVLPRNTPLQKKKQISIYGARVHTVPGHYTHAVEQARHIAERTQAYLAGDYALRREGEKTVAYEILDQLDYTPDRIICPMGNGTLVSAVWQGLLDFKRAGLIRQLSQLIGVQASGCAPIATAYRTGKGLRAVHPHTIASAVACGDPLDGLLALRAIKESCGAIFTISDADIIRARHAMAREYGIDAEPAGVLPYAALQRLKGNKQTVLVITGNGMKDLKHV